MPTDTQDTLRLIMMIAMFLLVLALWIMAVVAWNARRSSRQERIERRLEMLAQPGDTEGRIIRLWSDGREASTIVPGLHGKAKMVNAIQEMRLAAGLTQPVSQIILFVLGTAILAGALGLLATRNLVVGGCSTAAVLLVAWIYLQHRIARRVAVFESQLVDAMGLAARSLRAGHPLAGAFRMIAQEIPAPVGTVFSEICQQEDLGVSLDNALRKVCAATPSPDLKLFATSIVIQVRSGGNLADMMERLAAVIRDRLRLARRVRVLIAQTKLSKHILLVLPFFIFVVLNMVNPQFMKPLYSTSTGHKLLAFSAVAMFIGAWVMNRLAVLRY